MSYLFGLLVAGYAIFYSSQHLGQQVSQFYDPVAAATVIGGTIAVFFMTFPWDNFRELFNLLRGITQNPRAFDKKLTKAVLKFSQSPGEFSAVVRTIRVSVASKVIADGVELVGLGFGIDRIEQVLKTRTHQTLMRRRRVADTIRSLAKYPPAFGLLGTVLGLVTMMREISTGSSSSEAGLKMSVALVATLYGILVSNLILNPLAEAMVSFLAREKNRAEFANQAIRLYFERATQIESREVLQSYLLPANLGTVQTVDDESPSESETAA